MNVEEIKEDISGVINDNGIKAKQYSSYVTFLNNYRWYIAAFGTVLTLGLVFYAFTINSALSSGGFNDPNSESSQTDRLFYKTYVSPNPDIIVLIEHSGWTVSNPNFRNAYNTLKASIQQKIPDAHSFISFYDYRYATAGYVSKDKTQTFFTFRLMNAKKYTIEDFTKCAIGNELVVHWGGYDLVNADISTTLAYGGLVAALLPLILALWTVVMSFTALHITAITNNVTLYVFNVVVAFGIGIAIDFSLFLHLRFTEEMLKGKTKEGYKPIDAVEEMMFTSGRTVIFSAVLLMTCIASGLQFYMFYLTTMSLSIVYIALFAAIGGLVFIPAFYLIIGEKVFYLSNMDIIRSIGYYCGCSKRSCCNTNKVDLNVSPEGYSESVINDEHHDKLNALDVGVDVTSMRYAESLMTPEDKKDLWFRSVMFVVKYPWPFFVAIFSGLVVLTVFFVRDVRFAQFGFAAMPVSSPIRYTYDSLIHNFANAANSGMDVYIQTQNSVTSRDFITSLNTYCNMLSNLSYVKAVSSMVRLDSRLNETYYLEMYADPTNPKYATYISEVVDPFYYSDLKHITRVGVALSYISSDPRIGDAVNQVRSLTANSFHNLTTHVQLLATEGVTGSAATQYDQNESLRKVFPGFLAVIFCSMFFFLVLLTGSIFLPIKAIVVSCLSIMGSFAFVMFVFQNNNGSSFLHFYNDGECLDPLQLLFIFSVSFGLSLDYEVFILGRMQEVYKRTGSNAYSIAKGISSSARSVSVAAVLVVCAIGGFIVSSVLILQLIGMGIGVTILLDATIVRLVLIPSMMSIAGDRAWWAPAPVKKLASYFEGH